MTAAGLGLAALVLVGPGPLWVSRWRFLLRIPRAAVVLWQAGAVAALVTIVTAGVTIAAPLVSDRTELDAPSPLWRGVQVLLLAFSVLVVGRGCWSLLQVAWRTRARRERHRNAVDLLGRVDGSTPGLRVLAQTLPLAYCLPGLRRPRVVLSSGTLAVLTGEEVRAVIAHERAHLRARHDLVLDTFTALHQAFPFFVRSSIPAQQCRLLVELLADDAARRQTGPLPLARALVALADAAVPFNALGLSYGVAERVGRLSLPLDRSTTILSVAVYALAAVLVLSPALLLGAVAVVGPLL